MWLRTAIRLSLNIPGSFPRRPKPAVVEEESPPPSPLPLQQQRIKPWEERTIEEKLNGMHEYPADDSMPTAEALALTAGVTPSVIGNVTNEAGEPVSGTKGAPRLRGAYPASNNPGDRLKFR